MEPPRIAGWHGKLPTVGDFAARRLDADFVGPWDEWLSRGLARLRQRADWPAAYLASPSWRFLLLPGVLPGVAGQRCWAGVLMPSVDRVGRYYPLTIAAELTALPARGAEVEALWNWLVRLDEAAADALHEDWSIDTLEAQLQQLPLPALAAGAASIPEPGAAVLPLMLGGAPHPGLLLASQAAGAWGRLARGLAYWSAQPEFGDPSLLCSQGLQADRLVERLLGATVHNPA